MSTIHITEPGGQPAQYPEEQARALWVQGQISPQAYYWKEGMPDWRPAVEFFGESQRLGSPPPLAAARSIGAPRGFAKDPTTLTRFLKVMLWISLSLSAVSAVVAAIILMSGKISFSEEELTPGDIVQSLIGLAQLVVYITTAVSFLMWIHRANCNARHLGAQDITFTPAWSVGWYFIPIFNLWKPYQAMKQIWQASQDPANWPQQPASLVAKWWSLWLLTHFLGLVSIGLALRGGDTPSRTEDLVDLGSDITDVVLCASAIRLVSGIFQMQSEWARRPAQPATTRVFT